MALTSLQKGILIALNLIKDNGPQSKKFGLCQNVTDLMRNAWGVHFELEALFASWPLHSGDDTFPVPCPDKDPADAYLNHTGNMWGKRTIYGQNRWSLLDHCIQQLSRGNN